MCIRDSSELENGKDVSDLAEKIICKNPDIVLVSQEVGYGVVPVDAFDKMCIRDRSYL